MYFGLALSNHVVYMLWFNFILGLIFLFFCFKLIIIHYHTQKQKKIKIKPKIKLNHNIYTNFLCLNYFWQSIVVIAIMSVVRYSSTPQRKLRWWAEFLSRGGGRHCYLLARDKKKKDRKKLWRKLVDHCLKQGDHKQQTLKQS